MSCKYLSKCLLIVINAIFLLDGLVLTAVGSWVLAAHKSLSNSISQQISDDSLSRETAEKFNALISSSTLQAAAIVIVVFGVLSLVTGFCGCCGAIKESSCLLTIYAVAVSAILLAEVAGAIAAGVFKSRFERSIKSKLAALAHKRFLPLNKLDGADKDQQVTTAMFNYLHISLKCCGVTSELDFTDSDSLWSKSDPEIDIEGKKYKLKVPVTCCRMKPHQSDILLKHINLDTYLVDRTCPITGMNVTKQGCYEQFEKLSNAFSLAIIIACSLVAAFELLCVLMAAYVIHKIRARNGTIRRRTK